MYVKKTKRVTFIWSNGFSFGYRPHPHTNVFYLGCIILIIRLKEKRAWKLSNVDGWPRGWHYIVRYGHLAGETGKWAFKWRK